MVFWTAIALVSACAGLSLAVIAQVFAANIRAWLLFHRPIFGGKMVGHGAR